MLYKYCKCMHKKKTKLQNKVKIYHILAVSYLYQQLYSQNMLDCQLEVAALSLYFFVIHGLMLPLIADVL